MNKDEIMAALAALDVNDDANWTSDGLPRLGVVGKGVTREDITTVAPHFTRSHPSFDLPEGLEPKEPQVEPVQSRPSGLTQDQQEMLDNMEYLKKQAQLRKERMARTREVSRFIKGAGPIGASPIDQKIARVNRAARRGRPI